MRIVRTRSIGNVDNDRLLDSMRQIHEITHTAEGLRAWDEPRKRLVRLGIKGTFIGGELTRRGVDVETNCMWCKVWLA